MFHSVLVRFHSLLFCSIRFFYGSSLFLIGSTRFCCVPFGSVVFHSMLFSVILFCFCSIIFFLVPFCFFSVQLCSNSITSGSILFHCVLLCLHGRVVLLFFHRNTPADVLLHRSRTIAVAITATGYNYTFCNDIPRESESTWGAHSKT